MDKEDIVTLLSAGFTLSLSHERYLIADKCILDAADMQDILSISDDFEVASVNDDIRIIFQDTEDLFDLDCDFDYEDDDVEELDEDNPSKSD